MRTLAFVVVAAAALAGSAHADLVYTMRTKALKMDPPAMLTHRMSMAADRMTLHSEADGKATQFVFRGDKKLVWMIEPVSHSYMEIDEASVKALAAQVGPMIAHMQERMAELPPEQRAEMEKILNIPAQGTVVQPKVELRRSGDKEKIAGYDCVRWDVLHDGAKTAEVWATNWKAAGTTKQDFAVLRQLTAFLETLHAASPATRNLSNNGELIRELDRVDGFPVRIRQFEDGMLASESTVESIDTKPIAATAFEVPAGYSKQAFGPAGR